MQIKNQRLLYIIQHANNEMFKIGIATDNSRFKQIDSDYSIDWTKSLYFKGENEDIMFMEKILHRLFFKYRLKPQQGTGGTEWFSIDCLEKVVDSIIFNVEQSEFNIDMIVENCELNKYNKNNEHSIIQDYTKINAEWSINYVPCLDEINLMECMSHEKSRFIFYVYNNNTFYYNTYTKESIDITEIDYQRILTIHLKYNDGSGGFNMFSCCETHFTNNKTKSPMNANINDYFNSEQKEFCLVFNRKYNQPEIKLYPDVSVSRIYEIFLQPEHQEIIQNLRLSML
jgi:hypothetical protein